ncbi:MAG: mechanosensitive ion channel family protein [Suipraeoptans sp.]
MTEEVAKQTEEVAAQANVLLKYLEDQIPNIISFGFKVILAIVAFIVGRLVIKLIRKMVAKSLKKSNAETGISQFVDSLLKYGLYVVLVFLIISALGISTTSVAAVLASTGVALGLALQGSLSNFAGGVLILLLKPFKVGDYIVENSNANEGTVKEIQIFYTKLQTVDGKTIVIPNGMLTNNSLVNVTASDKRQLDLKIDVPFNTDITVVKELINDAIVTNDKTRTEEPHSVFVNDVSQAGIIIGARSFVATENFYSARCEILEEIKLKMDEAGIKVVQPNVNVKVIGE